jgi:hypothetical protein
MQRVIHAPDIAEQLKPLISHGKMRANGYGRRFVPKVKIDQSIVNELFFRFGLVWEMEEPELGHFVGTNYLMGAHVHIHTDPAPEGFHHVRCNVAVEMPKFGGEPILDGVKIGVKEGDAWVCFSSIEEHSSTPIKNGDRVIVSVASLIEKHIAETAYINLTGKIK